MSRSWSVPPVGFDLPTDATGSGVVVVTEDTGLKGFILQNVCYFPGPLGTVSLASVIDVAGPSGPCLSSECSRSVGPSPRTSGPRRSETRGNVQVAACSWRTRRSLQTKYGQGDRGVDAVGLWPSRHLRRTSALEHSQSPVVDFCGLDDIATCEQTMQTECVVPFLHTVRDMC